MLGRETKRPPARRAERSRAWGGRAGQPRRDCATTPRSRARVPTRAACDARGTHDADAADAADDADGAHDADGPEGAVRWIDVIGLAPPGYPSGYPCSGRVPVSAGVVRRVCATSSCYESRAGGGGVQHIQPPMVPSMRSSHPPCQLRAAPGGVSDLPHLGRSPPERGSGVPLIVRRNEKMSLPRCAFASGRGMMGLLRGTMRAAGSRPLRPQTVFYRCSPVFGGRCSAGGVGAPVQALAHQPVAHGDHHRLHAVAGLELLVDARQVALDRLVTQPQRLGDAARGLAGGELLQHVLLAA